MRLSINIISLLLIILSCSCSKNDPKQEPEEKETTVTDIDGNIYLTVKIGTQEWMAENLKVSHYSNGDEITSISGDLWDDQLSGACCVYDNNQDNKNTYGLLYNWFVTSDIRGVCPDGWHVPSYSEWETLATTGLELKEPGTSHWLTPNTCLPQSSGFKALPGGNCGYSGSFNMIGEYGYWWTATQETSENAWITIITYQNAGISNWGNMDKWAGASIRCIKDSN